MKYSGEPRLYEPAFTPLGKNKTIFVVAQSDLFADGVEFEWIDKVLFHCLKYDNSYMIQTKNTQNLFNYMQSKDYRRILPPDFILGTTIETDNDSHINAFSGGNLTSIRSLYLSKINHDRKYITCEPLMKFNLYNMVELVVKCKPEIVYVGFNSFSKIKLPEPSKEEAIALIEELRKFTKVKIKTNAFRVLGDYK